MYILTICIKDEINNCLQFRYGTLMLPCIIGLQVLSMSRLGGAGAVAPLVADMSSEVYYSIFFQVPKTEFFNFYVSNHAFKFSCSTFWIQEMLKKNKKLRKILKKKHMSISIRRNRRAQAAPIKLCRSDTATLMLPLDYYPSINQFRNSQSAQNDNRKAARVSTFWDSSLSLTIHMVLCFREAVTVLKPKALTTQTATKHPQTTVSAWQSNRWRSWWRKTWVPPCSTFRGRVYASCPFLSPRQSPKPRVAQPTTSSPTILSTVLMGHPLPECPRSLFSPLLWVTASSKTPPPFPNRDRAVDFSRKILKTTCIPQYHKWWRGFSKV